MPQNANGSSLNVTTNYGNGLEPNDESYNRHYMFNQTANAPREKSRRRVVVNKEARTKVTYTDHPENDKVTCSKADEALIAAADADAKKRGVAPAKKTRKPRAKKTTKPTDTEQ